MTMIRCLPLIVGSLAVLSCASAEPVNPVRGIHPAIDSWQEQAGVEVSRLAQRTLISELQHSFESLAKEEYRLPQEGLGEEFSVVLGSDSMRAGASARIVTPDSAIYSFRVSDLIELYLFDIRNRLAAKERPPAKITWFDLQHWEFRRFFGKLAASRGERGWVLVRSNPSGAEIFIEGKSKGITLSKLAGAPGSYRIQVRSLEYRLNCERNVIILPERTQTVDCP